MESTISDVEFIRLQNQLLELKDANYQLNDKCRWQDKELTSLREQVTGLDKDLQRSNMAIFKSKKAKEYEQLMKENESLQNKLISQEEDFRMQNGALMKELADLVETNEKLEREIKQLKESSAVGNTTDEISQDSLRRLQAQNAALQHSLTLNQKDIAALKQTIIEMEALQDKSSHESTNLIVANDTKENDREDTDEGVTKASVEESEVVDGRQSTKFVSQQLPKQVVQLTDDSITCQLNDLRLQLETESQENRLLHEQLKALELKGRTELTSLKEEVDKLTEKLRKKQESLVQLQNDKERLMEELKEKLNEAQLNKQNELASLQSQNAILEQKLSAIQKMHDEVKDQWHRRTEELEARAVCLEHQASTAQQHSGRELAEMNAKNTELVNLLEQRQRELSSIIDDLQTQLKASQIAQNTTAEQMLAIQVDRDSQIQALQEANRLAEKRKSLLDELAIKYQQESSDHHEQLKSLNQQHASKVEELTTQIEHLQAKCIDCDADKELIKQQVTQISSLETAKNWLDKRLKEVEENLKQTEEDCKKQLETAQREHEEAVASLSAEHEKQVESVRQELTQCQDERDQCNKTIEALRQEIKDHVDERKLHEKKGATVLKDLKRQVQTERKRADKLQEKLQELLSSDSMRGKSVDELFRPVDNSDRQKSNDSSSVCSMSPSSISRDTALAQTPEEDGAYLNLRMENEDLMRRLGEIQQQMWTLEEKVAHLESSNAAMAEDLLMKTAVIEHYVMDKPDHHISSPVNEKLTLKRVVDFVIDKGDENLKDMNRKMQRILEETLMKNMHLQRDLEAVSKELERTRVDSKAARTAGPT